MSTPVTSENTGLFRFAGYTLDASRRLLSDSDGANVALMPKAFDILFYLVKNSRRIVEKDEIIEAVWPDTAVEENNLTQNISSIRKALGERHGQNKFIATVPGKGYKFVADVEVVTDDAGRPGRAGGAEETSAAEPQTGRSTEIFRKRTVLIALAAAVAVLLPIAAALSWRSNKAAPQISEVRSIAVLPFKPLTLDRRDESLEMGMADTLILKLSGVEKVRVRPLTAIRRYSSVEQDALAAGRELGVDTVLDGRLQIADDRIRASVELVNVADGRQLWAGQFDERLTDIFAIQDSIAQKVANQLKFQLGARGRKSYTESVEAYQLYMRGNLHTRRLIRAEVEKGIEYYKQAIEADPAFALAFVEIANARRALVLTSDAPTLEMMPEAKAAAVKAVELDPELSEAWTALATSDFWFDWDWQASEQHYKKAIELDGSSGPARMFYAHMLSNLGRHDEAIAEIRMARQIEPASLIVNALEGQILFFAGDLAGSEDALRRAIDLDPNFWLSHLFITRLYIKRGQYADAAAEAKRAAELSGGSAEAVANAAYALAADGKKREAEELLGRLTERARERFVPSYPVAQVYLALGNKDNALELLEKALNDREVLMVFLKVDPKWDAIRNDPRFVKLLERMRFN